MGEVVLLEMKVLRMVGDGGSGDEDIYILCLRVSSDCGHGHIKIVVQAVECRHKCSIIIMNLLFVEILIV